MEPITDMSLPKMKAEYVYLLQEREFVKTKENIFKVGKTKQVNSKRLNQYPKDTVLLLQIICSDCDKTERSILNSFQIKYKQRKDVGNEYFEGDYKTMISGIYDLVTNEDVVENTFTETERNDDEIEENVEETEEIVDEMEENDNEIIITN